MNEHKLSELLERAADRTPVNPPPVAAMRTGATRRRRRRTALWSVGGTAVAVAAVIGGSTLLGPGAKPIDQPPVAAPPPAAAPVPAGMRLVGVGNAAVAVPKTWGTNKLRCGTPEVDTVVVDVGAQPMCAIARRPGVESIDLGAEPRFDFKATETIEIDGVAAQREKTTCVTTNPGTVCAGSVLIPSLKAWFRAESSTSAAEVDRILEQIRVVPDQVGVPGFQALNLGAKPAEAYQNELKRLGLVARSAR